MHNLDQNGVPEGGDQPTPVPTDVLHGLRDPIHTDLTKTAEVVKTEDVPVHLHITLDGDIRIIMTFKEHPELNGTFSIPATVERLSGGNELVVTEEEDHKTFLSFFPDADSKCLTCKRLNGGKDFDLTLADYLVDQGIRPLTFDLNDETPFTLEKLSDGTYRIPLEFQQRFTGR